MQVIKKNYLMLKQSVHHDYQILFRRGEEENPRWSSGLRVGRSDFSRLVGTKRTEGQMDSANKFGLPLQTIAAFFT